MKGEMKNVYWKIIGLCCNDIYLTTDCKIMTSGWLDDWEC